MKRSAGWYPLIGVCLLVGLATSSAGDERPISRILFGSCIKQDRPMPIFKQIVARKPEVFVFLGDNIYADTVDMQVMRAKYAKLKADPGFHKLTESCAVLATWDDHDYGLNDAGADYAKRVESQQIFLDFWGVPASSPRRRRPGVYDARVFGPEGKRVQFILLDTRYFRGTLARGERQVGGPYKPSKDTSVTMLGERQWEWLEEQLKKTAELRIVASSIQLVADSAGQETWANLPHERKRFFELIRQTKAEGVVVISGDRHWSELSAERELAPYPIYDLTSSSINQPHGRGTPTDNSKRSLKTTYHQENFGEILVDWNQSDVRLQLQIIDAEGQSRISKQLRLSELRSEGN